MTFISKTLICTLLTFLTLNAALAANDKIVIAHRGASGYLPEHTLEAKVLAHAMGADYIEQDVVMTKDNALVVVHDFILDQVTDVVEKFPGRAREDGRHYVIDFTLNELRQLRVTERTVQQNGASLPVYPDRFPPGQGQFGIHTMAEEIELIQGLNATLGREVGIYVEIKGPWFHHREGKDQARAILQVLKDYGYTGKDDKVFLQTFDFNELKRVREELMPAMGMDIRLAQLIALNEWQETFELKDGSWVPYDYNWMFAADGMTELSRYADGVGPAMEMIVSNDSTQDNLLITPLVERAHAAGLQVHPYTFRRDAGRIPDYAENFERLLEIFYFEAGVDGLKTDFPDLALEVLESRRD